MLRNRWLITFPVLFVLTEMTYDVCVEVDEDAATLHITDTASTVSGPGV